MVQGQRFLAQLVLVFALAACAGKDFSRLTAAQMTLGKDTESAVRKHLGNPYKLGAITKHNRQFGTLSYAYADATGKAVRGTVTPGRGQNFYVSNGVLVGHDFTSSWAVDATDFDDSKISQIEKGKTTVEEVVRMLGQPGGEYIYPLVEREGEKAIVYRYEEVSGSGFSPRILVKSLIVSYDGNNVVTDVEFARSGP